MSNRNSDKGKVKKKKLQRKHDKRLLKTTERKGTEQEVISLAHDTDHKVVTQLRRMNGDSNSNSSDFEIVVYQVPPASSDGL